MSVCLLLIVSPVVLHPPLGKVLSNLFLHIAHVEARAADMVTAGKGRSVTGLDFSFRVVTTLKQTGHSTV